VILQWLRIEGSSLSPGYEDGDYVLVSGVPVLFLGIHPGDVVVFNHPRHGKMIKIVERLEPVSRSVFVVGSSAGSVDSRTFGPVPRGLVMGKVIWHIPKTDRKPQRAGR
jgi:signal peptidase I